MSLTQALILLIVLLTHETSWSTCERVPTEKFSGEFKIENIEPGKTTGQCQIDVSGEISQTSKDYQFQSGCLVTLKLLKIATGKKPVAYDQKDGLYKIYNPGPLCKATKGTKISKTIESSQRKCCAFLDKNRDETKTCKGGVPILKDNNIYLSCISPDVRWIDIEN